MSTTESRSQVPAHSSIDNPSHDRPWRELPGWPEARAEALARSGLPPFEIENQGNTITRGITAVTASNLVNFAAVFTTTREAGRGITGAQRRRAERLCRRLARRSALRGRVSQ